MAGCERCALKRRIREREKREKKRKKGGEWGSKSFFFFISPRAGFFICAVVIFQIYKENCI